MAKDVEVTERGSFSGKDYHDPPPAPLIDAEELTKWSFYRALIAEFIATLLFLYITVLTVIGYKHQSDVKANGDICGGVGILGIAWAFGGMIFILVYCTAGISGSSLLLSPDPFGLNEQKNYLVMLASCFANSHYFLLFHTFLCWLSEEKKPFTCRGFLVVFEFFVLRLPSVETSSVYAPFIQTCYAKQKGFIT